MDSTFSCILRLPFLFLLFWFGSYCLIYPYCFFMLNDIQHKNPLCSLTPLALIKQGEEQRYDKEKYRDMLLEAAKTVLGYFGFDRTDFGDIVQKRNKKWWYAISEERNRDIENEKL